ncbi:PREDICTED: cell wall integrity and stress response component 4-like [Rhagoletis zephyria]|uniref:cell wall integrity and stress response component 4-like n=1 Tax=Rhagoletis zephyria TaxID=28612 RepID=UPI0008113BC7|nr:PREDICTED: cell wall integrity and stress response component 4-like [Rhagoletis zephyria]
MRDFIEHTLGLGTYMKSRPKLEPFSSVDNGSFIPTLMPPIESVGGQHSQVGGIYANYRAAYVRRDEETVVAAGPEPPPQLVTPDARLQKSLNLSSPDMKSENITESISKMIELSPGSAVEAAAAAPLGNGTTATTTTIPTTTITSNISDITIPITTTIAPSFAEEILTTIATDTGTFINSSKENNSSSIELDEKPLEVEDSSHFSNETKSEASETLIDANDMVIEGSGFAPETPEPLAKDVAQQPTLASMLGDELTTQSDSALADNSNAQIEETTPATTTVLPFLNSADEVFITTTTPTIFSSPPELNESLPDQFTTTTLPTTTSAEEIETTESVFTLKGNATNSSHSSPTVTTFMPEKRSNVFRVEDASNSTVV